MKKYPGTRRLLYTCCLMASLLCNFQSKAAISKKPVWFQIQEEEMYDLSDEQGSSGAFRQQLVNAVLLEYLRWNHPVAGRENDSMMCAVMKAYWANLGQTVSTAQLQDSLWEEMHPWSAAFIAWVMRRGGAGEHFYYAPNHAAYIVASRENVKNQQAVFKAYDIKDSVAAWPKPGDLLCKNRDGKTYSINSIGKKCISHCDVVVETDTLQRTVTTIGGNVNNRVAKRTVFLNEHGMVDERILWCITDDPLKEATGAQADYFAIIKTGEIKAPVSPLLTAGK